MAERPYREIFSADGVTRVIWETMVNNDTGQAFLLPRRSDRTVQVKGTFGGATMTMRGSLDDPTSPAWDTVSDAQGNDLDIVEADKHIEVIQENTYLVSPIVTGGGVTTDLDVTLMLR